MNNDREVQEIKGSWFLIKRLACTRANRWEKDPINRFSVQIGAPRWQQEAGRGCGQQIKDAFEFGWNASKATVFFLLNFRLFFRQ